jgi:hypothetical protein
LNYIETLLAEWLEYRGFFLRRNAHIGLRSAGGYAGEVDIVALRPHPEKPVFIHIECSMDVYSKEKREERFTRKFQVSRQHVKDLFDGFDLPVLDEYIVFGQGSVSENHTVAGVQAFHIRDVMADIASKLALLPIGSNAVPEAFPLIRTIQYLVDKSNGPGFVQGSSKRAAVKTFCADI